MGRRIAVEGSHAISEAVKQARVDVIAAYPITPQTHIVERLSEMVADGELDAEFVPVESEHSAMSVCIGAEAAGARAFTCTSGPGLALMAEIVFIASSMRLPILMVLANRTLSAPLSIWNDHSDAMLVRDCGWIQIFVNSAQEAYDHVFIGYRVGEDSRVLLPVMLHMDGFFLTHAIEPLEPVKQELIDGFLPPYEPLYRLHPDKPVTMGAFALPDQYAEIKKAQDEALKASYGPLLEAWKAWGELSGRHYGPVEGLYLEDAEVVLLTAGSYGEVAHIAVEEMRAKGRPVGLVKLRLWRPFPYDELRKALEGKEMVVVIDRSVCPGGPGGPMALEVRSALYGGGGPKVVDFIVGISGRDVTPEDYIRMIERVPELA
ncbi:MAG: pyruvate ferredoxin oxidoreductase, partial [Deltaproteobacteria bacterium]